MAHCINDYSELWSYAGEQEKQMATLKVEPEKANSAKASLKPKVTHLSGAISEEKKMRVRAKDQKKELDIALADVCHDS